MSKIAAIILLLVVYNVFFFPLLVPEPGRLEFVLFQGVLVTVLWLLFSGRSQGKQRGFAFILSLAALLTAGMSAAAASELSAGLLWLVSLGLVVLTTYLLMLRAEVFGGLIEAVMAPVQIGAAWLKSLVRYDWGKAVPVSRSVKVTEKTTKTIRGLLIATPILLVVIGLLSSADPIFNNYVRLIFKNPLPKDILTRFLHSGLLLIGLLPLAAASIRSKFSSPTTSAEWKKFPVEATIIVGSVTIILASFLFIQFRYLFASVPETQLHQFGINTYSEYVRKGFGELLFVTGIVYVLSAASFVVYRASQAALLQKLNLLLIGETALFTISIFRRVYLYALHHGLTLIRIYGSVLVLYLLGLIVVLGLRHLSGSKRPWYVIELGMGILLVGFVTVIKPDYLIATKYPPTVNNEIDYSYIARLSADALPGWVDGFNHAQQVYEQARLEPAASASAETVRQVVYAAKTVGALWENYQSLAGGYGYYEEFVASQDFVNAADAEQAFKDNRQRGWLKINLAEQRAYRDMQRVIDIKALRKLQTDFGLYLQNVPPEKLNVPFDRSADSPLL